MESGRRRPDPRFRKANEYVRLILRVLSDGADHDQVQALRQQARPEPQADMCIKDWLKVVPDDILVPILRYNWIDHAYLMSPAILNMIAMRGTSRCLETLMSSLGSLESVAAVSTQSHCLPTLEAFVRQHHPELQDAPFEGTIRAAVRNDRHQTVEFLVCYSAQGRAFLLRSGAATSRYVFLVEALNSYEMYAFRKADILPWIRLYVATGGDRYRTDELYQELAQAQSDANPGLNFPAGYTDIKERLGIRLTEEAWVISSKIRMSIYGWSFRLNREKRKRYTEADMVYLILVWNELAAAIITRDAQLQEIPYWRYPHAGSWYALKLLGKAEHWIRFRADLEHSELRALGAIR